MYNYRRLPILEETASEIQKVTGNKVLALQCDVRDPEAIKNAGIFLNKRGWNLSDWVSRHFSVKLLCSLLMKAKVFMKTKLFMKKKFC